MRTGVVVVGGGAAGLAAATTVAAAGQAVVLVSAGPLGGDCTWHGCVPTKSLLEAAGAGTTAAVAVAHARAAITRLARSESPAMLRDGGVEVVRATGRLRIDGQARSLLLDDGRVIEATLGVVLATGSRPVDARHALGPLHPLPAGCTVSTTEGWLDAVDAHLAGPGSPGPVVVVGGGPTGVELAQALARLGVGGSERGVTLVERDVSLLVGLPGAGEVVAASLAADGVRVVVGAGSAALADAVRPGSLVLVATGRAPALDVLGDLDDVRAPEHTAAGIRVDAAMRSTVTRVCAAGDVTGLQPSTHVATATGRVAAATLLGHEVAFDVSWVPRVVYTDPEVAAVGRVPGPEGSRTVRVPVSRADRAVLAGLPGGRARYRSRGGFAQVWVAPHADGSFDRGGVLAGALVVGPHAGELVAELSLAGRLGLTVEEWSGGVVGIGAMAAQHAYPTWSWWWQAVADRLLGR